jgi:hypothetical protein
MFPMKFFEYLAAGKAVVSVDLASLCDFKDYVRIAPRQQILFQHWKILRQEQDFC